MSSARPPAIPYLGSGLMATSFCEATDSLPFPGMYLVDLSFISDGNPHSITVNWPGCAKVPYWPYLYMTAQAIDEVRTAGNEQRGFLI